jgi:uncharacterized protein YoxC
MISTIIMSAALSACQTSQADSLIPAIDDVENQVEDNQFLTNYSERHQMQFERSKKNGTYVVYGTSFTSEQLTEKQKATLAKFESNLVKLERAVEVDGKRLENWGIKIERVAEKIELEVESMEAIMDEIIDYDSKGHAKLSQNMKGFSREISSATTALEKKMRVLERQMRLLQTQMPEINEETIRQLENEAVKMEKFLIEVSDTI